MPVVDWTAPDDSSSPSFTISSFVVSSPARSPALSQPSATYLGILEIKASTLQDPGHWALFGQGGNVDHRNRPQSTTSKANEAVTMACRRE
jgi:hypothetical protein